MRHRSGHVYVVAFSGALGQLGYVGWCPDDAVASKCTELERSNTWEGVVLFGKGIESPQDREALSRHIARGNALGSFERARPQPPVTFPRVDCAQHGATRIRFLVCSHCGHVEDMEAAPKSAEPVLQCPGGCGKAFTPLADPEDFTARALCLVCGLTARA